LKDRISAIDEAQDVRSDHSSERYQANELIDSMLVSAPRVGRTEAR